MYECLRQALDGITSRLGFVMKIDLLNFPIPAMYSRGVCSIIIGSLGTILEEEMATRATMEASRLGAKKMLFDFGSTQPSG